MKRAFFVFLLFFVAACISKTEDPQAAKAKSELAKIDEQIASLDAKIAAIPSLELSVKVKQDIDVYIHFIGAIAELEPNNPGPGLLKEMMAFGSAFRARDAPGVVYQEGGPEAMFPVVRTMVKVTADDLAELEKLADTYDSAVSLAKAEVKQVPAMTAERTSSTEKYFQDYAKKKARYEAMAATLEGRSSAEFRARVEKIKKANQVVGTIEDYLSNMPERIFVVTPELRETFPSAVDEAEALTSCYTPSRNEAICDEKNLWDGLLNPLFSALYEEFKTLK